MSMQSAESSQAFTRRMLLPLAALVVALLVSAIGGLFVIADYQTDMAIAQQARLAQGAFRIQGQRLAANARDYGFWDDAVEAIAVRTDRDWMIENVGGADASLGIQMSFVIDPDNRTVYSHIAGVNGTEAAGLRLGRAWETVLAAWRRKSAGDTHTAILPYGPSAAIVAIAPVRSFTSPSDPPTGHAIVFVRLVDDTLLRQWAADFELANVRAVRDPAQIADRRALVSVGLASPDGRVAQFAWDPERPGDRLLRVALPFLIVFVAAFFLLGAVFIRHIGTSAKILLDREARAARDPLTGLANRSRFFARLSEFRRGPRTTDAHHAVMYIDLDGFKGINDTYGHAAGDALLTQVALRLQACVGQDGDMVARLGGDEFAAILVNRRDRAEIQAVGISMLLALAEPFRIDASTVDTSASIGIAICRDAGEPDAALLDRADRALYAAKASGRNALRIAADDDRPHPQPAARGQGMAG